MDDRPSNISGKIKSYTDLLAWQKSKELSVKIYKLTEGFPKYEMFGLVSQMRRAAVSVPANLAEGFGRWGKKEKDQFFSIASGSLSELETHLIIAKEISLISTEEFKVVINLATDAHKLINGLRKSNRTMVQNRTSKV